MTTRLSGAAVLFAFALLFGFHVMTHERYHAPPGTHEIGVTPLPFGEHGEVKLRGPFGQVLTLEGAGPKQIQWAPVDRRVEELEFRAFITTYGPDPGFPSVPPLVRWRLDYGHGQLTYQSPVLMPYTIEGGVDAFSRNVLPARGLCLRTSARELKMTFESPSKIDNTAPWGQVKISVSLQPVYAGEPPLVPKQHYAANLALVGGFPLEPFPPEATEFRIFDEQGQPYPPGSGNMAFIDLGGQLIAAPTLGVDLFATFQPIPVHAAAWGPPFDPLGTGFMCSAEYR
jgi:hypothetical protein